MLKLKTLITGIAGLAILATAGGLMASAAFNGEAVVGQSAPMHGDAFPSPIMSGALFVNAQDSDGNTCMSRAAVISRLKVDMAKVGGEIYVLKGGLEQAFADEWRHQAHEKPVPVTGVVAHLFPDAGGSDYADVVEFDGAGCAMSRTMLSGQDWDGILNTLFGAQA
jgi:hypothetical protein